MLVLSRKNGQAVKVGDSTITIVRVRGSRVLIGIDAPRELNVRRTELPERKTRTEAA